MKTEDNMIFRGIYALLFICLATLFFTTCKEKELFREPEIILNAWSKASETLDYEAYKRCEAYPREVGVFNEMYRLFYFSDITITKIEELDEKDIGTDFDGNRFYRRNVAFECFEMSRASKMKVKQVKGEVFFIKFLNDAKAKNGWLMANRTIIRF